MWIARKKNFFVLSLVLLVFVCVWDISSSCWLAEIACAEARVSIWLSVIAMLQLCVCVCFMGLCVSLFHTLFPVKWWQLWACSAIIPHIHTHHRHTLLEQPKAYRPAWPLFASSHNGLYCPSKATICTVWQGLCVLLALVERWGQNLTNWRHFVIADAKMGSCYPLSSI